MVFLPSPEPAIQSRKQDARLTLSRRRGFQGATSLHPEPIFVPEHLETLWL